MIAWLALLAVVLLFLALVGHARELIHLGIELRDLRKRVARMEGRP